MAYIAKDYNSSSAAPEGSWVCTRTSDLAPFTANPPPREKRGRPDFCGQCVSYATTVCRSLPVATARWKKGDSVAKTNGIARGTIIATFNDSGKYTGHVAVFIAKAASGVKVYDQWVNGSAPKAIGSRVIRWNGAGINNGNSYYVVE